MKRRVIHRELTKEQIEFRNKLLNLKPKREKVKPAPMPPKVITRNEYMNNCMYWINEYEAERVGRIRFLKAVECLREFCNQIIRENIPVNS